MTALVTCRTEAGVAHVALNRPDKLNALDGEMFTALADAGARLAADRSVRAVVLSGEGRAFSAGLDFAGFQAMARALGGEVAPDGTREYGRTELTVCPAPGALHDGLPARHPVWMSHGDSVVRAPDGFTVTAASERAAVAAFEDTDRRLAGVQYHPEVGHSPHGQEVLRRFLHEIAGITPGWTTSSIIDETVEAVRAQVGDGRAICGLSGGVDSAVAAALAYAPSAVSQQLSALEREVGVPLTRKHGRRLALTPQGELLAQHAEGILAALESAERAVAASLGRPVGTVRVAVFAYLVSAVLLTFTEWPGPIAAVLPVLYALNCRPWWDVSDADSETANRGWKRFLWLNFVVGAVTTMLLIWWSLLRG